MKKWLVLVICLVVLILAAVATISYFLFFDNEEEERSGYEDITSWSDDYDAVDIDSVTKFKENMHVYFGLSGFSSVVSRTRSLSSAEKALM